MLARGADQRNVRIVIIGRRAARLQQLDDLQRRAFAHVVDIFLVGEPDDQHARAVQPLAEAAVERLGHLLDDDARHGGVDLAGKLDEADGHVEFARFPNEVEGVDRDAMSAEARAGIEGHEAEGLGARGLDHLPDVDAHRLINELQLVHERDIDRTEDVLGELHRLGGPCVANRHHALDELPIERFRRCGSARTVASHHLGDARGGEIGIARILPLGRIGDEQCFLRDEPAPLQDRLQYLGGRARIGGGFQHDELTLPQMREQRFGGGDDIGKIGLAVAAERGRHADENGVRFAEPGNVGGGLEAVSAHFLDRSVRNMPEIRFAGIQLPRFYRIDVIADDAIPRGGERARQRQADIAEADHPDLRLTRSQAAHQGVESRHGLKSACQSFFLSAKASGPGVFAIISG